MLDRRSMQKEPRFQDLLRRMGLEAPASSPRNP
jgi:hypothetical protein